MYFAYFIIISPWKRAGPFIWKNLNPLYPRMLCANFGWNWLSASGEEDFLILSMYLHYFVIISPWKRAGPFIWRNLNPLHPRMLCAKFGWNWLSGSGEEDENVKSLQTDRRRDDGRQVIRKAHLSFPLRWAKNDSVSSQLSIIINLLPPPNNKIINKTFIPSEGDNLNSPVSLNDSTIDNAISNQFQTEFKYFQYL